MKTHNFYADAKKLFKRKWQNGNGIKIPELGFGIGPDQMIGCCTIA